MKIKSFKKNINKRIECFPLLDELNKNLILADEKPLARFLFIYKLSFITLNTKKIEKKMNSLLEYIKQKTDIYESHYSDARKMVIINILQIFSLLKPKSLMISYRLAGAYQKARMTDEAIPIYQKIIKKDSDKLRESSLLKLAKIYWNNHDYIKAKKILEKAKDINSEDLSRKYSAEIILTKGLINLAKGNIEKGEMFIRESLKYKGFCDMYINKISSLFLLTVIDKLPNAKLKGNTYFNFSTPNNPKIIVVSGFGWSGSGAVYDFLTGFDEISPVFNGREWKFWSGNYGLFNLYKKTINKKNYKKNLLFFLSYYCFGFPIPPQMLGKNNEALGKNLGGLWGKLPEKNKEIFLDLLFEFVTNLKQLKDEDDTLKLFQVFSDSVLKLIINESTEYILLNNCINGLRIKPVILLRDPFILVTWRNMHDSFISKKLAFPHKKLQPEQWSASINKRINKYLRAKSEAIEETYYWLDIQFEDFILEQDIRDEIKHVLNLGNPKNPLSLNASVSKKNINIKSPYTENPELIATNEESIGLKRKSDELSKLCKYHQTSG